MLRPALLLLFPLLLIAAAALISAPDAQANGIMVTDTPGVPDIDIRRRRPPHPHIRRVPPVRLKGHKVSAEIQDRIASVTVEQVFHNHGGRQLEGTYLFPLPEGAVVSKFAMTMFGKMVQGEIIERQEARRIYESIVRRRRDPGLLEYMGRGLFRARVFPIEPHKDLTIRITYQQVLPEDAGTVEFRYPLATDRLNAAPVQSVAVDVRVRSSVDIKTVYSPSHSVEIKRDGEKAARVSYERSQRRQDKDLLLYVGRSPDAVGFSLQSHKEVGRDGTFMAVFAPRMKIDAKDRVPKDVVYVVDKSGSMAGPKMDQAKQAISYGVRMLRPGDRFNVLAFSTNLYPFRDGLVEATKEMQEAAVKHIEGLDAAGGTNIDGALQQALTMRQDGRLFLVVFITDGKPTVQETNPRVIVENVKKANTGSTRVFTFGVGYNLDVRLLDRIAEVTNGTRDYVTPGEDLEVVTGRFFRKVDQPALTEVKLELGSGIHDVYPKRLPDLFAGGQVVVFGRYKQAGDRTVLLRGKLGKREIVYEHNTNLTEKDQAGYLPRLWAFRKVAYLLDEIRLHGENKELVDEVVKLATRHGIVTPYTAGLVVEESEMQGRGGMPADDRLRRARLRWHGGDRREAGGKPRLGGLIPTPTTPAPVGRPSPDSSGRPSASPQAPTAKKLAGDSERLRRLKEGASAAGEDKDSGDDGLGAVRALIKSVGDKTFQLRADGVWVDKAWDGKKPTTKVEAWSQAYFELLKKGDKVAKLLAVGEKVIFVLGDTVYEIAPPAK
ncbi:MAG: VIT domain-containing protein [Planctomycetota bacterium]|nr:VIT domain-containing protein [Planctomycetota bacterium]